MSDTQQTEAFLQEIPDYIRLYAQFSFRRATNTKDFLGEQ
jgi:hypothetical protein